MVGEVGGRGGGAKGRSQKGSGKQPSSGEEVGSQTLEVHPAPTWALPRGDSSSRPGALRDVLRLSAIRTHSTSWPGCRPLVTGDRRLKQEILASPKEMTLIPSFHL